MRGRCNKPGVNSDGSDDEGTATRLVILVLLVVVVLAIFGLSCGGLGANLELNVTCDQPGAIGLVKTLIFAIAANQGTYLINKRSNARLAAKQIEFPF